MLAVDNIKLPPLSNNIYFNYNNTDVPHFYTFMAFVIIIKQTNKQIIYLLSVAKEVVAHSS